MLHSLPDDEVPDVCTNAPAELDLVSAHRESHHVVCEHAEPCGGCPLIEQSYDEQLLTKRARLALSTARYASLEGVTVEATLAAEPIVGYRTRAKLVVGSEGRIGLYGKGGAHQLVDIPGCRVLAPALASVAAVLRVRTAAAELTSGVLAPFGGASPNGALRAVDLREVRDPEHGAGALGARVFVTLVLHRPNVRDLDRLREAAESLLREEPLIASIAASLHDGEGPQLLGSELVLLAGATRSPDRIGLSTHLATHGAFVQSHRGQTSRMHTLLREATGAGASGGGARPRVLDLYGGSGSIALALAEAGAEVHSIESFAPAVDQARAAASEQKCSMTAEVSDAATALRRLAANRETFDAIVVNPPRRGVSPAARELIATLAPKRVAYVSCDPDTLARDLDHFARLGYAPSVLKPLDMIPLTEEVETIALLARAVPSLPRVVCEAEDFLVVEKSPHEPTVPQGEYVSSLMDRVRLIAGAERATPVYRLDVGTSGLVLFARRPEDIEAWSKATSSSTCRRVYLAAVRGVPPMKGAVTRELREGGVRYPARTRYRRLATFGGHGMVRAVPEVGRTHQVRRHLAAIGHPVLGDDRYGHGPSNRYFEERHALDRTFLHCVRLEFTHPTTEARVVLESPLPGDLRTVLERLGGQETMRSLEQKNALGGFSSMPPPALESDTGDGSPLDVDASSPTIHPEPIGDETDGDGDSDRDLARHDGPPRP